jgi:peptide/nickel transport system ATP-binding protein
MTAVIRVDDLRVFIRGTAVVDGVSFEVRAGECLAIVGESGAGKTLSARSLLGMLPAEAVVTAQRLEVDGLDVRGLDERGWRRIRGARVGLVSQDALAALDPLRRVGREVAEAMEVHGGGLHRPGSRGGGSRRDAIRARVLELLDRVAVPEPALRARQRPHELSGGLRQRALIASAISADPVVLVADEPTTALDATVQRRVLDLLGRLKADGLGILLVTHDLSAVAGLADRVAVMRDGRIVEHGPTERVLDAPQHPFTRALIAARPVPRASRELDESAPVVLEAVGLRRVYGHGRDERIAVRAASLRVQAGRTLGIVGESGSGKSTLARLLLAIESPDAGEVLLRGAPWSALTERRRRPLRGRVQLVDQDALGALNPRWTVRRILDEALAAHGVARRDRAGRARELLEGVGLPATMLDRRPGSLSGGQRQRVAIARALATDPEVLVCDEPVSALDATVQARVLELLQQTQERLGIAIVLISHDLAVVAKMADEVLVMRDGDIVERGATACVLRSPKHPFTRELVIGMH